MEHCEGDHNEDGEKNEMVNCASHMHSIGPDNLLGQIVHSEEEAYKLYCNYGYQRGFSIRRWNTTYYTGTRNIRSKEYCCSKEGLRKEDNKNEASHKRLDRRTGCKAKVRFTVDKQGIWNLTFCFDEHNHELATHEERHLLRSARSISNEKAGVLDSMVNAGIRTCDAYSYLVEEGKGVENVGFSEKDCYNYVHKQRMMLIEVGDSQSLVNYFKQKSCEEGGLFYWDVQLDQEGHMTNFFWRDERSRIDYDCFGDVVVFDTTYRTNKYNLVCAPFVGINHHWSNVMFGCAFLLDETTASFEWLFRTFLESMGNTPPKTIITDQDQAMANAIEKVMPNTHHRLCLWHISKNAASHIGNLYANRAFQRIFNKCMQGCDSQEEFEENWTKMMAYFKLENHTWLNNLYKIRQKWCTGLNKDTFDAGIRASQRSESTNNVLDNIGDKCMSLTKFVLGFEQLVRRWREKEVEKDYQCHQSTPTCSVRQSTILKHAAKTYTHKLFRMFQEEYLEGTGAHHFEESPCGGNLYKFDILQEDDGSKTTTVHFDLSSRKVCCTCKKFETVGLLCSHALGVLHLKKIPRIPPEYILKRWTIDAKRRIHTYTEIDSSKANVKEAEIIFRNRTMRYCYDIVTMCQEQEEARKILWRALEEVSDNVSKIVKNKFSDGQMKTNNNANTEVRKENEEVVVLDPRYLRPKGISNSRLKGHFEKRRSKTSQSEKGNKSTRKTKQVAVSSSTTENVVFESAHPMIQPQFLYFTSQTTSPNFCPGSILSWGYENSNSPYVSMLPNAGISTHISQEPTTRLVSDSDPQRKKDIYSIMDRVPKT